MSVAAPKRNVSESFRLRELSETFLKSEAQGDAGVTLCFTFLLCAPAPAIKKKLNCRARLTSSIEGQKVRDCVYTRVA